MGDRSEGIAVGTVRWGTALGAVYGLEGWAIANGYS